MAQQRISRGAPYLLTAADQDEYVRMIDTASAEYKAAIEAVLGIKLDALSYGEKVTAYANFLKFGRASAALAAAAKSVRDVIAVADETKTNQSLAQQVAELRESNEALRAQVARSRRST